MRFQKRVSKFPKKSLYHFDESGFDLDASNEYGYAKIGERLAVPRSGRRSKRLNVLAAQDHNHNLVLPKIYDCTINKEIFKEYLKNYLLPNIPKGSIIILDNAKFHHDSKAELANNSIETIKDISNQFNVKLVYLPPYSPDLNPIEKKWAQVKYWYKRLKDQFEDKREFLEMLLDREEYSSLI
jgi:isftu1 transposase